MTKPLFKRQYELNSSLVIKIDPEVDIETDDSSTDEDRPFIKSKTGEFTYLDADEELLEPFEKLGWFSGRPNYYFAENIFIWVRTYFISQILIAYNSYSLETGVKNDSALWFEFCCELVICYDGFGERNYWNDCNEKRIYISSRFLWLS